MSFSRSRSHQSGLRPITGPPDCVGNRSCVHDNFNGVVFPFLFKRKEETTGYYVVDAHSASSSKTQELKFTHLLGRGLPEILWVEYAPDGKPGAYPRTGDGFVRARWVGNDELQYIVATWTGYWSYSSYRLIFDLDRMKYSEKSLKSRKSKVSTDIPTWDMLELPDIPPSPVFSISSMYIDCNTETPRISRERLAWIVGILSPRLPNHLVDKGGISQSMADDLKTISVNLLTFTEDILRIKNALDPIIHIIVSRRISVRDLASLELSSKYGLRLTVRDAQQISSDLRKVARVRNGYLTTRGRGQAGFSFIYGGKTFSGIYTRNQKVWCEKPGPDLRGLIARAQAFNAFPSTQNVWDFIPFSFVVDWIVDVSGALEALDARTFWASLRIVSAVNTDRWTVPLDGDLLGPGIIASVTYTSYRRFVTTRIPLPTPRLAASGDFHNYVEAGALIVQAVTKH